MAVPSRDGRYVRLLENEGKSSTVWDAGTGELGYEDINGVEPVPSPLTLPPQFELDGNRLVRLWPNGDRTTLCFLPPSFSISCSCFRGPVVALGLTLGQVVIIHMLE
jgi:hypothetical protein